jgi:hypothetical protein
MIAAFALTWLTCDVFYNQILSTLGVINYQTPLNTDLTVESLVRKKSQCQNRQNATLRKSHPPSHNSSGVLEKLDFSVPR